MEFDHVYLKPRLVHNWPYVKEENDELSDRILNLANVYSEEINEKKKQRIENENNPYDESDLLSNKNQVELKHISEEENFGNLKF